MNETGSYPGQPWLWLYTLWYQVPGFDHSANVDLIAIYLTGAATISSSPSPSSPDYATSPESSPSTASSGATGTTAQHLTGATKHRRHRERAPAARRSARPFLGYWAPLGTVTDLGVSPGGTLTSRPRWPHTRRRGRSGRWHSSPGWPGSTW